MATSITCNYNGAKISVEKALTFKQEGVTFSFLCAECGQAVRPHSGGGHTQAHFEHIQRNSQCSLSHNSDSYQYISSTNNNLDNLQDEGLLGQEAYYLRKQRLNQGVFRQKMLAYWGKCSVTGVLDSRFLIASHIKPWSECLPEEKLSENNGLLLIASYDFLFDNLYLTFSDKGRGILSDDGKKVSHHFGIQQETQINQRLNSTQKIFMEYHRQEFYKKSTTA